MSSAVGARDVFVVGVGLHRYQRASSTPYVTLGLTAVRQALRDAELQWPQVGSAYVGTALLGVAPGREMLRYLGATGLPIAQVENASASGSTAFRHAVQDVASGYHDVSLAVGVDKPEPARLAATTSGVPALIDDVVTPLTHFALLMQSYLSQTGASVEQIAAVAVKNHANGVLNPYAQRQKARTLEEVLAPPRVAGQLTRLQCTPIGEGAAAVIVASADGLARFGVDLRRAVRVLASQSQSEALYDNENFDAALTRSTGAAAMEQASVGPEDLDVVELHDAFTIEELLYTEALGLVSPGEAAAATARGEFDIGGRVAVSASGGLLAMGHPTGPTGVGQVVEVVRQLRGEAGDRQHPTATTGLVHMVGLGAVCVVHVLQR